MICCLCGNSISGYFYTIIKSILFSETIEKDDDNIEVQVTCASTDTETSTDTFEEEITTVSRKSPSEPISTMCYSMKRQIISR